MVKRFGNTFCVSLQDNPKNISQFLIYDHTEGQTGIKSCNFLQYSIIVHINIKQFFFNLHDNFYIFWVFDEPRQGQLTYTQQNMEVTEHHVCI
jgi:hypothetical protein